MSGCEHTSDLLVAVLPSVSVDVAVAVDAFEIREVDVQYAVALRAVQPQFHYHLVGDESGFSIDVCQSLCICGCHHHECCYDC